MAYVEKRGPGRWRARYRGPDGRERSRTFERKTDADRWLVTKAAEMMSGTYVGPAGEKTTLAAYAAEWSARMRPTWRVSTAAGIANNLDKHILPVLGRRPVSGIRKSDVEALCSSLALAPSTVATVHQHLGQLLAGAVEDGLIARNPATRARLPKRESSKAQPVPLEVVEAIRAGLPGLDWRSPFRSASAQASARGRRAA